MKKLLVLFLFPFAVIAQQKAFIASPYVVLIDTTTKYLETRQQTNYNYFYSLFQGSAAQFAVGNVTRIFDCYDGVVFSFADTLVTADVVQVSTTGIFKITPHSALISTTKRDILVKDILLNYNTATQTLIVPSTYGEPLKVTTTATGKVSVTIYMNGNMLWGVLPTNFSAFGSGIKKIVVN